MRKVLPNCRKCSEVIDPSEKRASGGNLNVCKPCRVAYFDAYNATRDRASQTPKTDTQKRDKAAYCANYWRNNRDRLADYQARYREANRERINARQRAYRDKNLEDVKASKKRRKHTTNARNKYRYETDPCYKLKMLVRARLREVIVDLKGVSFTSGESYRLLGCSLAELKTHIEQQFRDGMTWENHASVWELDHIKPLAGFNLIDPPQLAEACHYTNLQPLLCSENSMKSDFYNGVRARRARHQTSTPNTP
jgi:hypothetical protein